MQAQGAAPPENQAVCEDQQAVVTVGDGVKDELHMQQEAREVAAVASAVAPPNSGLPPGWRQFTDTQTGNTYYQQPDGQVTWNAPFAQPTSL